MYKHLTREQRYAIYLGQQKGETLDMIARSIGVHKSTVSHTAKLNVAITDIWGYTLKSSVDIKTTLNTTAE